MSITDKNGAFKDENRSTPNSVAAAGHARQFENLDYIADSNFEFRMIGIWPLKELFLLLLYFRRPKHFQIGLENLLFLHDETSFSFNFCE